MRQKLNNIYLTVAKAENTNQAITTATKIFYQIRQSGHKIEGFKTTLKAIKFIFQ